ncbi:hypothetical protein ECC02_002782 [Trypanosoma cruzi]|uniref:Uncharacterized protein n=1 Tax=Trypanosoma cruzi TaxID=5693 RepID=A0A7J6YCR5_TRYCR|nr:hypothetical protein ECC02_007515 [Trypanosoma cruzi]KAF5224196.1 hypothetical protein ECC02_002782 [Trypanosoma cruzi]
MASSFLVPFTLHVKRSETCESLHEDLGPLLSLLREEGNCSPRTTPASTRPATSSNTLHHLLENATVLLPDFDAQLVHDEAVDFTTGVRLLARFEQSYVSLIFKEYCKRKSIEKEREEALDEFRKSRQELMDAELPLDVRESLAALEMRESNEREALAMAYKSFVDWVDATTPQWLEAVARLEKGREAKAAAVDAAKRALEDELAQRHAVATTGQVAAVTDESLRRQAIAMVEQEQERRLQAQEDQVNMLRLQEEQLRRQIEENRRRSELEREKQHEAEIECRHKGLLEQESTLQQRLSQYEKARMQREEERRMMLEHIAAEEELLRHRLEEREMQRKKAEEEKERMERESREELYEHVEAEEELLRQRLQRYEEAREVEAEMLRRRAEKGREELYEHVRAEEEILRRRLEQRRREEEEEELQKEMILKAMALEKSALEERERHREEGDHQLQGLEDANTEDELRLLLEMEARQKRRIEEHRQQSQTQHQLHPLPHNHYYYYHQHYQHHQLQLPDQPPSSTIHNYHDPMSLNPPPPPPPIPPAAPTLPSAAAVVSSPDAYPWGNNTVSPSSWHHPYPYPHLQQPAPPGYPPFSVQR